ncbi:hypothetical protein GJ496_005217 [Pomphorhynchus laevis]|nr:hypothetical protein GJ496_005217 [Pomphorhynchus laevis]
MLKEESDILNKDEKSPWLLRKKGINCISTISLSDWSLHFQNVLRHHLHIDTPVRLPLCSIIGDDQVDDPLNLPFTSNEVM